MITGEPGVDYPIYNSPPDTGFSCADKDGLYADPGAECQAWHVCLQPDRQWSFLCPNGTIFNQEIFTCVWWFDFDCSSAESFYSLNDDLYSDVPSNSNSGGDGGGSSNNRGGGVQRRPSGGSRGKGPGVFFVSTYLTISGGGESKPASNSFPTPSRTPRPPSGGRRPGSGGSGGRRPGPGAPVTAEPGLVLVLPGLEDDDLSGYGARPADSLYGAPGGRRG